MAKNGRQNGAANGNKHTNGNSKGSTKTNKKSKKQKSKSSGGGVCSFTCQAVAGLVFALVFTRAFTSGNPTQHVSKLFEMMRNGMVCNTRVPLVCVLRHRGMTNMNGTCVCMWIGRTPSPPSPELQAGGENVDAFDKVFTDVGGNDQHNAYDADVANSFYNLASDFYEYG